MTCPAEHPPAAGLSADRETATAEAAAQLLRAAKVEEVYADRSPPYIFVRWHLVQAEINVLYDDEYGVLTEGKKTHQELDALAAAQKVTEEAMRMMCEMIAKSDASADGSLRSGRSTHQPECTGQEPPSNS